MRRALVHLAKWGQLHRINDYLDEHVLSKQTKPPIHPAKIDFTDWDRTHEYARHGKERFEVEEAPLEHFMRDSSGRDMRHTEGLDATVQFERFNSSKIARGLVMNRWTTPFQFQVVRFKTHIRLTPRGKAGRITCLVMVGNCKGVAGLGYGRHNNFRAKGPVTQVAIQRAFRNLVAINPDPPYLQHTIRTQWRNQKLILKPCDKIVAPFWLKQAARMFGFKGIRVKVIKARRSKPHAILKAFMLGMEKYHRSTAEIAAQRGLVPQGNIRGVKSYVEEVRAYKGMYTKSPPITDRQTAADRWKWDTQRNQVLQYPNPQLLHEIMYSDLKLGMDAVARQDVVPVALENMAPGPLKDEVEKQNSGATVSDYWEANEQRIRKEVSQDILRRKEMRHRRRKSWITRVLRESPKLTSPEVDEHVQEALRSAIRQRVSGAP